MSAPTEYDITTTHLPHECELCAHAQVAAIGMLQCLGSRKVTHSDGQHVAVVERVAVVDDIDRCAVCGQAMHRTSTGLRHFVPCGTAVAR